MIASAPTIIGSSCPPQGATGGRAQGALACPCLRTRKRWFDGARPQGIRRASGCRRRRSCRCAEHRGVGAGDRDRVDTRPAATTANRNDDEAGKGFGRHDARMLAPRRRHRFVHGRKPEQWRRNGCLLALWNLQGLKFSDDVLSCGLRAHLGIDIEDAPVGSDVEGPPGGEWAVRVDDAVRGRRFLVRVAQDGIVGLDVLGELLVRLGIIDARSKVDDVGEGPDGSAALTERPAFRCSATGERLGEPRENYRLALVVR